MQGTAVVKRGVGRAVIDEYELDVEVEPLCEDARDTAGLAVEQRQRFVLVKAGDDQTQQRAGRAARRFGTGLSRGGACSWLHLLMVRLWEHVLG